MRNNGKPTIYGDITEIVAQGFLENGIPYTDVKYLKDNTPPLRDKRLFGKHDRHEEYVGRHFTLNQSSNGKQSFHIVLENEPLLVMFPE